MRWEVLAAINEIETDYGRNLNVSTAGAVGWMQFLPSTWKMYGVDANDDGRKDPYNPVDAIFAAARYLKAAGADQDVRRAIFAYNHADWYVESVLLRARLIGGLPTDLVGSLTGLTQGHFPVYAQGALRRRPHERRTPSARWPPAATRRSRSRAPPRAAASASSPRRARPSSPPRTAGSSGSARAGGWAASSSCATSTATPTPTGSLKSLARAYPVPNASARSPRRPSSASSSRPATDPTPTAPAAGRPAARRPATRAAATTAKSRLAANGTATPAPAAKERVFANP